MHRLTLNTVRTLAVGGLASLCALVGVLVLAGVPAQAALVHDFLPVPSEAISKGVPVGAKAAGGEEALSGPVGGSPYYSMTVAPGEAPGESGHLWVAEPGRVDEFNASSGEWESQLEHAGVGAGNEEYSVAVGGSTGEREVYTSARVGGGEGLVVFGPSGKSQAEWVGSDTPEGSFSNSGGRVSGISVDNSASLSDWAKGDVLVSTSGYVSNTNAVVDIFMPEKEGKEKYITQLKGTCPVEGTVLGAATCQETEIVPFVEQRERRVAVDLATGDLLVANGPAVSIFEPVGLDEYKYLRQITGIPGRSFKGSFEEVINSLTTGGGEGGGDFYVSEDSFFGYFIVYEFNSEGVYLASLTGTAPGDPFGGVRAVAVDPASGDVYVGEKSGEGIGAVDVFGPALVLPDVTAGAALDVSPSSATLTGTVNPLGEGAATCQFEWGTTKELGHTAKCSAGVPEGGAPVEVRFEALEGLQPDTTYYYRLQATNRNGTNTGEGIHAECEGEPSEDGCFTTPGPGVGGESASDVASTSATMEAEVDPNNAPTSYYFQYGSEACATALHACATAPAPPGAAIGSSRGAVPVSQHLQGLVAGAIYHYRVVAVSEVTFEVAPGKSESKVETVAGADQTFTMQGVGSERRLPDGRAWELVSPPEKEGALIEGFGEVGPPTQASVGGSAVSYGVSNPTEAEPQGNSGIAQDFSWRGLDGGWSTRSITPPSEKATGAPVGLGYNYRAFSSDLSLAVVRPFGPFTPWSPEASERTSYLRTDFLGGNVEDPCVSGCYRPLVTGKPGYANVPPGTVFGCGTGYILVCGPEFVGGTPDLSHVVLLSDGLTATPVETGQEGAGLYEWSAGESLSEQLQPLYLLPKSEGGVGVWAGGRQGRAGELSPVAHQLSDDGSVFFVYHGHLYLHDVERGESVRLDVARGVAEPSEGAAVFVYASTDGARVLFSDGEQLTKASGGGVYECRVVEVGGTLACGGLELTGLSGEGTLVGGSEDASFLYFVGAGERLYVDHRNGSGWTQTFIANAEGMIVHRVSPDGRWLAFESSRDLTGYDTRDALSGQLDQEVYLYDASSDRLVCASCNPTGARPVGQFVRNEPGEGRSAGYTEELSSHWLAGSIPGWTPYTTQNPAVEQPRYLSDGGRLFFNSHEALVPQDVNGTWDVYEYEPPGVGDCSVSSATFSDRSGGCVALISSGTSAEESSFLDASEGGGDVFFMTAAQLGRQDVDTALDVYDAHECTVQSSCPASVTTPPPCTTGDACKPAPAVQPTLFGSPSSETFSGAGNITPSSGSALALTPKSSVRAQKLAKALKACRKRGRKKQRVACERRARRAYGSVVKAKGSRKKGGR